MRAKKISFKLIIINLLALSLLAATTGSSLAIVSSSWWPIPQPGQKYWWLYHWTDGPQSSCISSGQRVGISAQFMDDGAFQNESPYLLSINFFKEDPCTYWAPNQDLFLRWYSKGMITGPSTIKSTSNPSISTATFMSFRGDSYWKPDRTIGSTIFKKNGVSIDSIPGRYAVYINGIFTYRGGTKYTYSNGDNSLLPNYASLPAVPIDADVVLSKNLSLRTPGTDQLVPPTNNTRVHCTYSASPTSTPPYWPGWDQEHNYPNQCTSGDIRAAMFMRQTDYVWTEVWPDGSHHNFSVYYVGYSESGGFDWINPPETEATAPGNHGTGACEEYWYAQGRGPIFIAAYPNTSLTTCRDTYLAANKTIYLGGGVYDKAIDHPEQYFSSNANLIGTLKLYFACITDGICNIVY